MDHLTSLNSAGAVLVELGEALVEVTVVEAGAIGHVGEGVLDESLGLSLVKVTIAIIVVLGPDLVNALANDSVNLGSLAHLFSFNLLCCENNTIISFSIFD